MTGLFLPVTIVLTSDGHSFVRHKSLGGYKHFCSSGKVFLMIKNGPGFIVSQMHSLFNKVVDNGTLELTYEIATNRFHDKLLIIWASRPNIEIFCLLISLILHQDRN